MIIEIVHTTCPYCRQPMELKWAVGGGAMPDKDQVLVADWLFHEECWDKQVEENPTEGA